MKGTHLGEFEELVLLAVGIQSGHAYGISVMDEVEQQTGRKSSISTIHSTLNRLETKGFISSSTGGSSAVRGGRSKRLYSINASGYRALEKVRLQREQMWRLMPKISFNHG